MIEILTTKSDTKAILKVIWFQNFTEMLIQFVSLAGSFVIYRIPLSIVKTFYCSGEIKHNKINAFRRRYLKWTLQGTNRVRFYKRQLFRTDDGLWDASQC